MFNTMYEDLKGWLRTPAGKGAMRGLWTALGGASLTFAAVLAMDGVSAREGMSLILTAFLTPLTGGVVYGQIDSRNRIQVFADRVKAGLEEPPPSI